MMRPRIRKSGCATAQSYVATVPIATFVFCAICFLATAHPALAQQAGDASKDMIGWMPREILERPLPLRQGIGVVHEKVTTSSPEAQAYYDQGVAYVHSFVWIEAARSFNQALRIDPSLAMADLGLSDVYIGLQDVPAARAAFDKTQSLSDSIECAGKSTHHDSRAATGLSRQPTATCKNISPTGKLLPTRWPWIQDNSWLWILRGFADEGTPFGHGQGGHADTIAFYDAAMASAPDSFVPHHYLAHTLENLGLAKLALEQTDIYVRLAAAIPHAHHMRGHDLRQLGRTEEAIQEFVKTNELENAYYQALKIFRLATIGITLIILRCWR